jgi:hypothetical protein
LAIDDGRFIRRFEAALTVAPQSAIHLVDSAITGINPTSPNHRSTTIQRSEIQDHEIFDLPPIHRQHWL